MSKDENSVATRSNLSDYFKLPNPGLRSYLDKVAKGNDEEYRTTFAKGDSLEKVLKDWESTLETIRDEWPSLVDFEDDLRSKVGPMSIQKPLKERMKDIYSYYDDILLSSTAISGEALQATLNEFSKIKGLRLRSQQRTVDQMKKSTNSGSPYFTKRKSVTSKTVPCRLQHNKHGSSIQILGEDGVRYNCAAVIGWRGQEGGPTVDDVKQRVVWMFPYAVNIEELRVYQPLIESCQRFGLVPAWIGMDQVDERITKMFDTKGANDDIICTDFSKFDQHFNPKLQDAAKLLLSNILTNDWESRSWLEDTFPIKYDIDLVLSMDKVLKGKHGMGSGSGGTNADETLVHRALQHEAAISAGATLNPNSQCLGDDGVLTYPGITVEDVMRSYTAHGLEMNESKQYVSKQDCVYLRRWHHDRYRINGVCVGVYSTYRALGRLMEQERFYDPELWSKEMVALRQLSIIENIKFHPLRNEFVEFCMKRDKYRLGLDIPGFLDNISGYAREAVDLMPDFLGYTKSLQNDGDPTSGIASWWVVQYLKSK